MRLDAGRASALALEASRSGSSSVSLVIVEAPDGAVGDRLLLVRSPHGLPPEDVVYGALPSEDLHRAGLELARSLLSDPRAQDSLHALDTHPGVEVYAEVRRPIRDLVIVGAGHIAQPMSCIGAILGFRVWVLDDRPDFATRQRFPDAHRVERADFADPFAAVPPGPGTHVLLVTRGHRYDYQCLAKLLRARPLPPYIGMIGSRRRVRATFAQLLDDGFDRAVLDHIHAPVGLDIGAETPEEIAVAVAAELIRCHRGGSGASLRETERVAERFFSEAGE